MQEIYKRSGYHALIHNDGRTLRSHSARHARVGALLHPRRKTGDLGRVLLAVPEPGIARQVVAQRRLRGQSW